MTSCFDTCRFKNIRCLQLFVPGTRIARKRPKGESVIIRETFSLPPGESAQIDTACQRSAMAGLMVNRSEIIRAGAEPKVYLSPWPKPVFRSVGPHTPST